jgi:hypothetical protein
LDSGTKLAIGLLIVGALVGGLALYLSWRKGGGVRRLQREDREAEERGFAEMKEGIGPAAAAQQLVCDYAGVRYERVNWPDAVAIAIDNTRGEVDKRHRLLGALGYLLPVEEGDLEDGERARRYQRGYHVACLERDIFRRAFQDLDTAVTAWADDEKMLKVNQKRTADRVAEELAEVER